MKVKEKIKKVIQRKTRVDGEQYGKLLSKA